jgi:hypothetical protein
MAKKKKKEFSAFKVPTGGGIKKKNYEAGHNSNRVVVKEGETVAVQFAGLPTDKDHFREFQQHRWQEGKNKYHQVPCLGEDLCPLCDEDDEDIAKTTYAFIADVWNFKTKKMQVLRGGKNMVGKIALRFEKLKKANKKSRFLKRVYEITAIPAQFTDYDVVASESIKPRTLEESDYIDLDEWLMEEVKAYYGDDMPTPTSLDDDDDEEEDDDDDDDDEDDEEEERPKKKKKRKK